MLNIILTLLTFAQALPTFSTAEKDDHRRSLPVILKVAAECLQSTYDSQIAFHQKYGASKYFGNRRSDYKTIDQRARALMNKNFTEVKAYEIARQQEGTACITMAEECLGAGFAAAGPLSARTWEKIYAYMSTPAVNHRGTDLQMVLRGLGWKIYYWNPSTNLKQMEDWDAEERRLVKAKPGLNHMPVWGNHAAHFRTATSLAKYYTFPVDNAQALVGFGTNQPAAFRRVPFFLGIANVGYHVFLVSFGTVIEAHSKRDLVSIDNIESAEFNPLVKGGAPISTETEKYRSGLIAVPFDF